MVEKYYADYNVQRYKNLKQCAGTQDKKKNAGLREQACEIAETIFCKQIKKIIGGQVITLLQICANMSSNIQMEITKRWL